MAATSDRLPPQTTLGPVRLIVSNRERSGAWYRHVLGLEPVSEEKGLLGLGAAGSVLVELLEQPGIRPAPDRGRLGLYHVAILLPSRSDLGRFVRHAAETGVRIGAADHLVSEALYLHDPDGLGIEVYADRPREAWRHLHVGGRTEVEMATAPLNFDDLLAESDGVAWSGAPAGTRVGHLHLHVGSLETARSFYERALGFEVTMASYPGALFLSAGGYHHHLGVNTWAGPDAVAARPDEARLAHWTVVLPDDENVARVRRRFDDAGYGNEDPWGTGLRIVAA